MKKLLVISLLLATVSVSAHDFIIDKNGVDYVSKADIRAEEMTFDVRSASGEVLKKIVPSIPMVKGSEISHNYKRLSSLSCGNRPAAPRIRSSGV